MMHGACVHGPLLTLPVTPIEGYRFLIPFRTCCPFLATFYPALFPLLFLRLCFLLLVCLLCPVEVHPQA